MPRLAKFQLVGPVVLFAAVLAAEGAAYALAQSPSSGALWYVNLRFFGMFQRSHYVLGGFGPPYLQLLCVALPLLLLAGWGYALKRPLLLAIASNLSLIYALFLPYAWYVCERMPQTVSLAVMTMPSGVDYTLCLVLLLASSVSSIVSHIVYLRALRGGG